MPSVGAELHFSDCDPLSGKVVVSRLNSAPDTSSNTEISNQYWIINSLTDANEGFAFLDSIKLTTTDSTFISSIINPSDAIIHTRNEREEGTNWSANTNALSLTNYQVTYDISARITGDQQIVLSNGAEGINADKPVKPCTVDSIPGKLLELPGNSGDYAVIPPLNLNTNTITMTAWIKPNGQQNDWAGILFSRGNSTTTGISIRSDNELRYHWNGDGWSWSSGAYAPLNEWSHVAFVIEPTQTTIYLNGVAFSRQVSNVIEAFDADLRI